MQKFLSTIVYGILLGGCVATSAETGSGNQIDAASAIADAAAYQKHCGICHLETGQGVPGAFPPLGPRLATWSASEAGQHYLISVVGRGLSGALQVNDYQYAGVMPGLRTQLTNRQIAELLNFVVIEFAGGSPVFSDEIVEKALASDTTASSMSRRPE